VPTEIFPPEGFFDGMERQEELMGLIPEFRPEDNSNVFNLEPRTRSDQIRSLRGSETDERKVAAPLASGIRYPENQSILSSSEIRSNVPMFPPTHAPRDDSSPHPHFHRFDGPRVEDYGRVFRQPNATDGWGHYSGYPSQDYSYPPRPATVFASEVGPSVRLGRDDRKNVTQRDAKRPKERTRDQAYRKRCSTGSVPILEPPQDAPPPRGGHSWPREESSSCSPAGFGPNSRARQTPVYFLHRPGRMGRSLFPVSDRTQPSQHWT
jgi:hypothetical protein